MTTPRQLVLLCDGTNNNLSGRHADTHVVLLAELLRRYPSDQRLVYYDPGVGNPGQLPGTTVADQVRRALDRIDGLAFGRGLYDNIAEGYRFLMAHWRPGDQIFVFGFSRGAFTARSIAGLVNAFGIIDSQQDTLVSSLVATYFSHPSPERQAITAQAARLFGQGSAPQQWPEIHFVGVWDTVASVGLPPFGLKITAKPDLAGKHFRHVRHALALDEQRAQFLPRAYEQDDGEFRMAQGGTGTVRQCWFRGSHCDVGGGNPYARSELSRAPFAWMLGEALACGLELPARAGEPVLRTEADVLAFLPTLDPHPPERLGPCIHSEIHANPLWALTGLKVRDTRHAALDTEALPRPTAMSVHPSVLAWKFPYPTHTVWASWQPRAVGWQLAGWVVLAGWMVLMGLQLVPPIGSWLDPTAWGQALQANAALQYWQFGWPGDVGWACTPHQWVHPARALAMDAVLIGLYTALLAPGVCRAFAHHAGLIALGNTPSRWLNRAGWALPLAVGADLVEDGVSALCLWWLADAPGDALWLWLPRLVLAAASVAKWVGLLGVAALIGSAVVRWVMRRLFGRSKP